MLERLTAILRERTGETELSINRDTVLLADLGMNSFELIEVVCAVEDEFDVEIPDRAIKNFKTVGDVIDFIEAQ